MRIGFSNIYAFRPHYEHLYYLSLLAREAGHETFFLTCDAALSNCYPRALRGSSKWSECPKCILGGARSYPVSNVTAIRGQSVAATAGLDAATLDALTLSSAATLCRTEPDRDWQRPEVVAMRESLHAPVAAVYASARRWIERNRLDAVFCFNGRMELTRALTLACEASGIRFMTHERPWFGNGIYMIPNASVLSIAPVTRMVREFSGRPLSASQAALAGRLVAERFLVRNVLEWRIYNKQAERSRWPGRADGPRVLVLPSSRNEYAGVPEWRTGWTDFAQALDDFMEAFDIAPGQVVIRCHPNWAEHIGRVTGALSMRHYEEWARARGVHCVASGERASTYDLVQESDIVVLNGSSAAIDAGISGKQAISLGPGAYVDAGFVRVFMDRAALHRPDARTPIERDAAIRATLRYIYLNAGRFPQFVDSVRAVTTTRIRYFEGADPTRLARMLETSVVEADDPSSGTDAAAEDAVIDAIERKDWESLVRYEPPTRSLRPMEVRRRRGLGWLDAARSKLPRGDGAS